MARYTVEVSEIRHYDVEYTVEADSPEEALEMAARGETEDEQELKNHGVVQREVDDESLVELDEQGV